MIIVGDCLDVMRTMADNSVDAIVTDPPYDLTSRDGRDVRRASPDPKQRANIGGFMGMRWDGTGVAFQVDTWAAAYRILKPGGHLLAFSGTRTSHRMVCAIEDAGFEIRDSVIWMYGSGFPKSLDVGKAIDKAAGATREVVGRRHDADKLSYGTQHPGWDRPSHHDPIALERQRSITAPATPDAAQWDGWGTALKPAHEPICVARKPLIGTVAANVLAYGTGAINVDGCRISGEPWKAHDASGLASVKFFTNGDAAVIHKEPHSLGRWPANLILSHHPDCREVGTKRVRGANPPSTQPTSGRLGTNGIYGGADGGLVAKRHNDADGMETVTAWECHESCPVRLLDEQAGERKSGAIKAGSSAGRNVGERGVDRTVAYQRPPQPVDIPASTGGPSRFFLNVAGDPRPTQGRWPANLILSHHSECREGECHESCPVRLLDEQAGERKSPKTYTRKIGGFGKTSYRVGQSAGTESLNYNDSGGPSRFFYCAKASRRERNAGLDGMPERATASMQGNLVNGQRRRDDGSPINTPMRQNVHPTVKPIALMRWLVRLVTPPGGTVLDPFAGSGSTGCAAALEGVDFIGIEQDPEYAAIAERRITYWAVNGDRPVKTVKHSGTTSDARFGTATSKTRCCLVCGNRTFSPSSWPACGHDDWEWTTGIRATRQPVALQATLDLEGVAD